MTAERDQSGDARRDPPDSRRRDAPTSASATPSGSSTYESGTIRDQPVRSGTQVSQFTVNHIAATTRAPTETMLMTRNWTVVRRAAFRPRTSTPMRTSNVAATANQYHPRPSPTKPSRRVRRQRANARPRSGRKAARSQAQEEQRGIAAGSHLRQPSELRRTRKAATQCQVAGQPVPRSHDREDPGRSHRPPALRTGSDRAERDACHHRSSQAPDDPVHFTERDQRDRGQHEIGDPTVVDPELRRTRPQGRAASSRLASGRNDDSLSTKTVADEEQQHRHAAADRAAPSTRGTDRRRVRPRRGS